MTEDRNGIHTVHRRTKGQVQLYSIDTISWSFDRLSCRVSDSTSVATFRSVLGIFPSLVPKIASLATPPSAYRLCT
jgi:hypothetical protein